MNASYRKSLPLYTSEIYDQVIDLPVEKPSLILISEKEHLELKSEVGRGSGQANMLFTKE